MTGFLTWFAAGVAVLIVARFVPGPRSSLWLEALIALASSIGAGMVATAMDFGGWSEADPRAVVFALLMAAAAIGLTRGINLRPGPTDH